MHATRWMTLLLLTIGLVACGNDNDNQPVELTISAAASLKDALLEIQQQYESTHDGVQLSFNFGASGALQQQIEQGAPADLFFSASAKPMDSLVEKGLIKEDKLSNVLSNALVVVTPKGSKPIDNIADLTRDEVKQIAIGIPASVPAGQYAQQALMRDDVWDALSIKTVQAKDVRQVLQYVETGNVDAGFVYETDARSSPGVQVAFTVDPNTYDRIAYPLGIVKSTKHLEQAVSVYEFLHAEVSLDIYRKYGFRISQ